MDATVADVEVDPVGLASVQHGVCITQLPDNLLRTVMLSSLRYRVSPGPLQGPLRLSYSMDQKMGSRPRCGVPRSIALGA